MTPIIVVTFLSAAFAAADFIQNIYEFVYESITENNTKKYAELTPAPITPAPPEIKKAPPAAEITPNIFAPTIPKIEETPPADIAPVIPAPQAPTTKKFRATITDRALKQLIIAASIEEYGGNCPCPYNINKAGGTCGKNSAYSRIGGKEPICYEEDITEETVAIWKEKMLATE